MNKFNSHFGLLASIVVPFYAYISINTAQADAPNIRWAQKAGGTSREFGTGIAVDATGNSYVIGKFTSSSAVFGSFALTNGGLFVAKYDTNGTTIWARQVGPPSLANTSFTTRTVPKIAADGIGNAFLAGTFRGQIDFGGTTLTNADPNQPDLFLAKYDALGNLLWARRGGGNGETNIVQASALAVDESGNCYLAGNFNGTAYFGTTSITASNNPDGLFTARFDSSGNLVWVRGTVAPTALGLPTAIALGVSGDYYLYGFFQGGNLTFGNFTLTNAGPQELFLVRYDSTGNVLWARQGGGSNQEDPTGLAVDASGACYLAGRVAGTGNTNGSVSFDGCTVTNVTFFLVKYDRNGNVLWCKRSVDFGPGPFLTATQVSRSAADAAGNCYLLGQFFGTATFDSITLTNRGGNPNSSTNFPSYFVAKFDTEGRALWAKQFGGADFEVNYDEKGGIAVDTSGNCNVAGFIRITNAVFDAFTLSTTGDEDIFVARIDADPPRLNIFLAGNTAVISWPTNQPGFQLESAFTLPAGTNWSPVTNLVAVIGTQNFLTNEVAAEAQFFRLRR